MTGMTDIARVLGANIANQVGGTFLLPGSTFSLAALGVSLLVFVAAVLAGKRRRRIRRAALTRALFPRRMVRTASGRTDLAFFIGGILFSGMTIGWAVLAARDIRAAIERLAGPPPGPLLPHWIAIPAVTLLLFVAYEFAYWLDHWLKHRVAFFWQFHKVHHQAESLSLLTNARVHPVDTIIFYNIVAVVTGATAALAGRLVGDVGPVAVGGTNALIMVSAVAITHLQHSHLWLRFGPRGSTWLLGPAHHQIHHSADPQHFDRNLGSTLAIFDRAFGTFFLPPTQRGAIRFGVDDGEPNPHGWRATLFTPFAAAAALLVPRSRIKNEALAKE
jgi:sterol desaturase/sphingolipid hydroxylase (fatty acid hydroxylase superfamily)